MAYAAPADVRQALAPDGSNAATLGTAASLDDGDLNDHIAEAQTEVDGKLGVRFSVPFADGSVPVLVAKVTRDIAAYLATLTYRRNTPLPDNDPVALRYARAQALLNAAALGKLDILATDNKELSSSVDATVVNILDEDQSLFSAADFSLSAGAVYVPWAPPY